MPFVNLTFFVWSQRLVGSIGETSISCRAVSGGGRGGQNPSTSFSSFSPYVAKNDASGQRGGTLPPGYYYIQPPSQYNGHVKGKPISRLIAVQIDPAIGIDGKSQASYGRDMSTFLIHGPGIVGSDGCIVIDRVHRVPLLQAVDDSTDNIVLRVTFSDPDGVLASPFVTVT